MPRTLHIVLYRTALHEYYTALHIVLYRTALHEYYTALHIVLYRTALNIVSCRIVSQRIVLY
jgi:hypothetical protein